jgi:bifunctional UDP-N-acetylglucosamine pyrophosphorylase/glucosamine-1-phosphate N-acetyltransferase
MPTHVVILAAGKGTRMNSDCPKVLHQLGGKPMLRHVLDVANSLDKPKIHVVIGHGAEQVVEQFNNKESISWVTQEQQLGTGHAVAQAIPGIEADDETIVLILCGDVPLIKGKTIEKLIQNTSANTLALLTLITENPKGLGRIVRNEQNKVIAIVEEKDASAQQCEIKEINSGIMAIPATRLKSWLGNLENKNAQGEYYLTDVIAMAVSDDCEIYTKTITDDFEVQGVNDKKQLARLERHFQMMNVDELLAAGATVMDPARVDVRGDVECGKEVTIDVNVIFEGTVVIGDGVEIGPNVVIKNSVIKSNTSILANSIIEESEVGPECSIGPFARLRPGTRLSSEVKVGNFVEIKNSNLGKGAKANHFSYIGDADLGTGVNVGAGTIFCNYDGAYKHRSVIGDNVFIGSNSTLVSPVNVSAGAFIAAGSTINSDVPENELAIGRGKQRNISGWKRPIKNID